MARTKNTPAIPAIDPAMLAAIVAALQSPAAVEVEPVAKPKSVKRNGTKPASKRVANERKPASTKRKSARTCNISAGEAWVALGADPEYQPKDETKPASSAQLWNLNANGMLPELLASLA